MRVRKRTHAQSHRQSRKGTHTRQDRLSAAPSQIIPLLLLLANRAPPPPPPPPTPGKMPTAQPTLHTHTQTSMHARTSEAVHACACFAPNTAPLKSRRRHEATQLQIQWIEQVPSAGCARAYHMRTGTTPPSPLLPVVLTNPRSSPLPPSLVTHPRRSAHLQRTRAGFAADLELSLQSAKVALLQFEGAQLLQKTLQMCTNLPRQTSLERGEREGKTEEGEGVRAGENCRDREEKR